MGFKRSYLLLAISLLLSGEFFAGDYYWVNNSGNWNDPAHWSSISGGAGGKGIPSQNDNIFIDANSFNASGQSIAINGTISLNNLSIFSAQIELKSTSSSIINIYGDVYTPIVFKNELKGSIFFKGSKAVTQLDLGYGNWHTNLYFESNNDFTLNSPLQLPKNSVNLLKGDLNLNGHDIKCSEFNA